MKPLYWGLCIAIALVVAGCDSVSEDDGGAPLDSASTCDADEDCGGSFCSPLRCAPSETGADARGCLAGPAPCTGDQLCDSNVDRCVDADACSTAIAPCLTAGDCDGDGARALECGGADCDDADASRFPGNVEVCDADDVDEDCDPSTFGFRDQDTDGWPDARCCNGDVCGDDCDDTLPSVHPSEGEACDGLDNDCDGETDEGVSAPFYEDADLDGHAAPDAGAVFACFAPEGFAALRDDCDDTRGEANPGGFEVCDVNVPPVDEDCDGEANPDELCNCTGSESGACLEPGVCRAGMRVCMSGTWGSCSIAGSAETCDGEDDDCDGMTDEGLLVRCFADEDGDTYPVPGAELVTVCPDDARTFVGTCPVGMTNREPVGASALDCREFDPASFPGATEVCDAVDQDCDGSIDEMLRVACWPDGDSDGYPASGATMTLTCPSSTGGCPEGASGNDPLTTAADCDDTNAGRSPAVAEACNNIDDDCDLATDEGVNVLCWADGDGDGFAAAGAKMEVRCPVAGGACPAMETNRGPGSSPDCDDGDSSVSPLVPEVCNGRDDDCDGSTDEGVRTMRYHDEDRDGFGDGTRPAVLACLGDIAFADNDLDCGDGDPRAYPGQMEYFGGLPGGYCPVGTTPLSGRCIVGAGPDTVSPSWDFDCNGSTEFEYPVAECTGTSCLGFCSPNGGVIGARSCFRVVYIASCDCGPSSCDVDMTDLSNPVPMGCR